jgi:HEAT repeats
MRDLQLWRLLQQRSAPLDDILPGLAELASWPLEERMPFLGFLSPLLTHPRPEARTAALTALGGARGRSALHHLVHALNDPDPAVRRAAVEGLRASVLGRDEARWIHPMFHPDAEVRKAAIAADRPFPGPFLYKLFLLADPECRQLVEQQVQTTTLTAANLPMLFDYLRRDMISAPLAQTMADRIGWHGWREYLDPHLPRSEEMSAYLRDAMNPLWPEQLDTKYIPDRLDAVLHLFWDDQPASADGTQGERRFFRMLTETMLGEEEPFHHWVVFTLLGIGAMRKSWPREAAEICAMFYPPFLLCPWTPVEVRRQAIAGLYRIHQRVKHRSAEEVRELVQGDVCRRPDGRLDLWAVGGVLYFLKSNQYQCLAQWVPLAEVVRAFQADPERGIVFLCHNDRSQLGRKFLIQHLCMQAGAERIRLLALLVRHIDAGGLDFLEGLTGPDTLLVVEQLLNLTAQDARALSANKIRHLATILGRKIVAGHLEAFLRLWLNRDRPEEGELGLALLGRAAREQNGRFLSTILGKLEAPLLRQMRLAAICCPGFPYDREVDLARVLLDHVHPETRTWAQLRLRDEQLREQCRMREEMESRREPDEDERMLRLAGRIRDHGDEELRSWADECLRDHEMRQARRRQEKSVPGDAAATDLLRRGVCEHLKGVRDPDGPRLEWCLTLLASHDPVADVAEQFTRFSREDSDFVVELDEEMAKLWQGEKRLPILGHAWLFRWGQHLPWLAELLREQWPNDLAGVLRFGNALAAPLLRDRFWEAVARLLELERFRKELGWQSAWEHADMAEPLLQVLSDRKSSFTHAMCAAGILMEWVKLRPDSPERGQARERLIPLLDNLSMEFRSLFQPWIDSRGLPEQPTTGEPAAALPAGETGKLLRRISASTDLPFLADCVYRHESVLTVEAARRLMELGEDGLNQLTEVIGRNPQPAWLLPLTDTIPEWPECPALEQLRRLVADKQAPSETRFRVGEALYRRQPWPVLADLLDAIFQPDSRNWMLESDYEWLAQLDGRDRRKLALAGALSPNPSFYTRAIQDLCKTESADPEVVQALVQFLELGTERMRELRVQAAQWLHRHGERNTALLTLLQLEPKAEPDFPDLLKGVPENLVETVVSSVLLSGLGEAAERMLLTYLTAPEVDPWASQEALTRLLSQADTSEVRQAAKRNLRPGGLGRARKLGRVAQTFAWGVVMARQLTGKPFTVEMIAGEELGYTRLRENKVFVSPMPLLREQLHAREIVRGLILHELGHHLYHKGEGAEEVWNEAQRENMHPLLNLVSDEHLERNLRARDRGFGDQLKLLDSYAFQHSMREVPVAQLLETLQGRAFEVLVNTPLRLARKPDCVLVSNGRILLEMERAGMSFPRFVRALRMGLGNRHDDPKVAQGLALFRQRFRRSTMPELLDVARKLREIFGQETDLLSQFGMEGAMACDPTELAEASEGLTDEELQEAIQRELVIYKTPELTESTGRGGRVLNLAPEEEFALITTIRPQAFDPERYAPYADKVARPAGQLRQYLKELGLNHRVERFRLRGKSFDRTRTRAVVLRGDPRMLIAREIHLYTDLFIGVLLDCSGSMSDSDNIEKAKLFGALLAEAVRGQQGIDLRLWGFTDRDIFDCGNAARPAIHDLKPDNGNNDAAALWHAAQAALRSRRRARMLVMISDGSPTGCSVAALQGLVQRLTRQRKILCAQVAVRKLDHICFPHYVLLDEDQLADSVRRFGVIISRLVRQALRR